MPHLKSYCRHSGGELAWLCTGSHNLSKTAWGKMNARGQLRVWNFELSVLLLPSRERAYQRSRWRGFRCAGVQAAAGPLPGVGLGTPVRFMAWQRGMGQAPSLQQSSDRLGSPESRGGTGGADGRGSECSTQPSVLVVPLPVPYSLPTPSCTAQQPHELSSQARGQIPEAPAWWVGQVYERWTSDEQELEEQRRRLAATDQQLGLDVHGLPWSMHRAAEARRCELTEGQDWEQHIVRRLQEEWAQQQSCGVPCTPLLP
jgi:hypothetical protein